MLKKLFVNVLLKRGAGVAAESLGKLIRHGMTAAGGALIAAGVADAGVVAELTGSAVMAGGLLLSLVRIKLQKYLG